MRDRFLFISFFLIFITGSAWGTVDSLVYTPISDVYETGTEWAVGGIGCSGHRFQQIDDAGESGCNDSPSCYLSQGTSTGAGYAWGTYQFSVEPNSLWVHFYLQSIVGDVTLAIGRMYNLEGAMQVIDADTITVTTTGACFILRYVSDPITDCNFDSLCSTEYGNVVTGWSIKAVSISGKGVSAIFPCAKVVVYYTSTPTITDIRRRKLMGTQ